MRAPLFLNSKDIKTQIKHFQNRRDELMAKYKDAAFLLPAQERCARNSDVLHVYRQDSSFYYLTGWEEAQSVLLLTPQSSSKKLYQSILFVPERHAETELWEGKRQGTEGALNNFGMDQAFPIEELFQRLPQLLQSARKLFYLLGQNTTRDQNVLQALKESKKLKGKNAQGLLALCDPRVPIGGLRIQKRPEELPLIQKACEISAKTHKKIMAWVTPGMNEQQVEVELEYLFKKEGCRRLAYGSIVAGGANASCLHYQTNSDTLKDGSLLLIDAGGEYSYYASDISRSFPIGKSFSKKQAPIYDLVLKAQKAGIALAQPGNRLLAIHEAVSEILREGLLELGILKKDENLKQFYPHSTSHWLGLDVHDAGLYSEPDESSRILKPGMLITIEPGLYFQANKTEFAAEYRDLGIRIEDDILITEEGSENLSEAAPKEREEIEELRAKAIETA